MRRHFTLFAAAAAIFTLVACDVADDTSTTDNEVYAGQGDASLDPTQSVLTEDLDLFEAELRVYDTTLNPGEAVVVSIDEGDLDKYVFFTDVNMKYDVIVDPVSGDPDLYTNLGSEVGPNDYTCAPQMDEGEMEACDGVLGGTNGEYHAAVEGATDTVFVMLLVESPESCSGNAAGPAGCSDLCPCGLGEGTCAVDDDCAAGLSCIDEICDY